MGLFPLIIGIILIKLVFWTCRKYDWEKSRAAFLVGIGSVSLAFGCLHYTRYEFFIRATNFEKKLADAQNPGDVEMLEKIRSGRFGFGDYLSRHEIEGVSIASFMKTSTKLQGKMVYTVWLFDFGCALVIASAFALKWN